MFGEQVVGFVVCDKPTTDLRQVHQHCRARLATFKVPRHLVAVESLPRNPAGKVLKTRLRELDLGKVVSRSAATEVPDSSEIVVEDRAEGREATLSESNVTPLATSSASTLDGPPQTGRLIQRLKNEHPASRHRSIVTFLQDEVAELADLQERPNADAKLIEIGLDSLMIVELRDRLQLHVDSQTELPATLVFDHPRIVDLATFLVDMINSEGRHPATRETTIPNAGAGHPSADDATEGAPRSDIDAMTEHEALQELLREIDE